MNKISALLKTEILVTLITWVVVTVSGLGYGFSYFNESSWRWWLALSAYVIFIFGFTSTIRDRPYKRDNLTRLTLMATQLVAIYSLFWLLPFTFNAILLTMWSALLVYWLSFFRAAAFSIITTLPFGYAMGSYWQHDSSWLTTLLFWTFSLFAMMMIEGSRREAQARAEAELANQELIAAHAMLESATREHERTKIARNIHDLLGHHLTALSIHLQVLHRQAQESPSDDAATLADNIKRCHSIARLLLQDVRGAVSDIREQDGKSLRDAVAVLAKNLPQLEVKTTATNSLPELTLEQRSSLIRIIQECMTNTLKHSEAKTFYIDIRVEQDKLVVDMRDSAKGQLEYIKGNGLKGIEERVKEIEGELSIDASCGFHVTIKVPVSV